MEKCLSSTSLKIRIIVIKCTQIGGAHIQCMNSHCVCARACVCVCVGGHSLALTSTGPNRFMVEAASQKTGPRFKVSHDRLGERGIKLWVPRYIHRTTTEPFDFTTGTLQTILSVFKLFIVSPFC